MSAESFDVASPLPAAQAAHPDAGESAAPPRPFDSPGWWLAVLLVLGLVAPFVPVNSAAAAIGGVIVLTTIYVAVAVAFASSAVREQQRQPGRAMMWFGLALAWWIVLQWGIIPAVLEPFVSAMQEVGGQSSPSQRFRMIAVWALTDLALTASAVLGGGLLARLIKTPNMLGPLCVFLILLDVWGVLLGGTTAKLLEKAPEVAQKAMASAPSLGAATNSQFSIPQLSVGAADFLFSGFLLAALFRLGMNWRGTARLLVPFIAVTLLATLMLSHLPGLLPIGLAAFLPNLKYFRYTREEKFALLYAGIFLIVLTAALFFGITSQLPQ